MAFNVDDVCVMRALPLVPLLVPLLVLLPLPLLPLLLLLLLLPLSLRLLLLLFSQYSIRYQRLLLLLPLSYILRLPAAATTAAPLTHRPPRYAVSAKLEAGGVAFKKRPDEGRMKGLAFALDPDKYAVELVPRAAGAPAIANEYSYSQTMFRIKDPSKTIPFYEALGMTLVKARKYGDFTNYFMCTLQEGEAAPADPWADEARTFSSSRFHPCLELTHNHGTEADAAFEHFNGNKEPRKGFGHIGFLVDDVVATCDSLRALSAYPPAKEPMGGNMKGLAFMCDPDGYWIEIIKRGGYDADATPYYFEDAKPADE